MDLNLSGDPVQYRSCLAMWVLPTELGPTHLPDLPNPHAIQGPCDRKAPPLAYVI